MEEEQELNSKKEKIGIKRICKLKFRKNEEIYREVINRGLGSTIVKVEFTLDSIFILLCNFLVNLADGRLMAKGKYFGVNKEVNNKTKKDYEEIKIKKLDQNETVLVVSISAGDNHVILLDIDKNIWGWGSNALKQINPDSNQTFFKTFTQIFTKKVQRLVI